MKKFLVTILAILYITTSSGAVVHLHYCMDKLVNWSFVHDKKTDDMCRKCGMSKKGRLNDCCKDEHKLIKIEKDQKNAELNFNLSKSFIELAIQIPADIFTAYSLTLPPEYTLTHAPPRTETVSLIVRHCHFRI